MKNKWFRKGLVLVIVVLFVGTGIVSAFNAGLTDEYNTTITTNKLATMDNHPPYVPRNPTPYDNETDVPINIILDWDGGDPDEEYSSDSVYYDIYFGKVSPPPLVAYHQIVITRYEPGIMDMYTTYYWQIVATDNHGASTTGPIWTFTTGSRTNNQPNPPEITVERLGGGGGEGFYWIYIKLTDPDGDNLTSYAIVYDKIGFGFIFEGPWENGTIVQDKMPHYYGRGSHEIKVCCADRWGNLSDWGYLEFTFPRNRVQSIQQPLRSLFSQQINQLLQNLIMRHQMRNM